MSCRNIFLNQSFSLKKPVYITFEYSNYKVNDKGQGDGIGLYIGSSTEISSLTSNEFSSYANNNYSLGLYSNELLSSPHTLYDIMLDTKGSNNSDIIHNKYKDYTNEFGNFTNWKVLNYPGKDDNEYTISTNSIEISSKTGLEFSFRPGIVNTSIEYNSQQTLGQFSVSYDIENTTNTEGLGNKTKNSTLNGIMIHLGNGNFTKADGVAHIYTQLSLPSKHKKHVNVALEPHLGYFINNAGYIFTYFNDYKSLPYPDYYSYKISNLKLTYSDDIIHGISNDYPVYTIRGYKESSQEESSQIKEKYHNLFTSTNITKSLSTELSSFNQLRIRLSEEGSKIDVDLKRKSSDLINDKFNLSEYENLISYKSTVDNRKLLTDNNVYAGIVLGNSDIIIRNISISN